jgi:hypothetical protein
LVFVDVFTVIFCHRTKALLRQRRRHSVASKRSLPVRLRSTVGVILAELNTLSTSADIADAERVSKAHLAKLNGVSALHELGLE